MGWIITVVLLSSIYIHTVPMPIDFCKSPPEAQLRADTALVESGNCKVSFILNRGVVTEATPWSQDGVHAVHSTLPKLLSTRSLLMMTHRYINEGRNRSRLFAGRE